MPTFSKFLKNNIQDDLFNACSFLLKFLNIKHSTLYLKTLLTDHLHSSSLLAVQDTLSKYMIESGALRKGSHSYYEFELPFICVIQQKDWPLAAFTVVTDINKDEINYLDPVTNKIITATIANFQSIDKGIIMLVDGSKATSEINLKENLIKDRNTALLANLPLILALVSLLSCGGYIISNYNQNYSWMNLGYLLTTSIGVLISILLLWHEFDKDNSLIKQVCGNGGKKVNCNAVLSSSHASLFGVSWSTWGGAFFCTLLLVQLLFANNFSFLVVTALFSILVVPYVFYSLYVQWRIVKQWCPLCLGIQALLVINSSIAIGVLSLATNYYRSISFQIQPFVITMLIGGFMLFLISALVPMLKSVRDSKALERNLKMFKSDKKVFKYFLSKSEQLLYPVDGLGIIVGNPKASNEIIKVCNPYCGPCSDMHLKLEKVISSNNDIKLRIIFTASMDKNDIARKPVKHFLAIQQKLGNNMVHTAINDWYSNVNKDYEGFANKFVLGSELMDNQNDKVIAMSRWVESMKIRVTPTLFVNGYELPQEFKVEDLTEIL